LGAAKYVGCVAGVGGDVGCGRDGEERLCSSGRGGVVDNALERDSGWRGRMGREEERAVMRARRWGIRDMTVARNVLYQIGKLRPTRCGSFLLLASPDSWRALPGVVGSDNVVSCDTSVTQSYIPSHFSLIFECSVLSGTTTKRYSSKRDKLTHYSSRSHQY
jgi:hypothetical protein